MSYTSLNVSIPKKDLAFFRKLSRNMGWKAENYPVSSDVPNEETAAAMQEAVSGCKLKPFSMKALRKQVVAG